MLDQIQEKMIVERDPEMISMLAYHLEMLEMDVKAEDRSEAKDWFDGLNNAYQTKSEYMRHLAQQRVRSYYMTAKEQIQKEVDTEAKELLMAVLHDCQTFLKSNDFHGSYFDRRAATNQRLCDEKGWFRCQGAFDKSRCFKKHLINPYASLSNRLLFSQWNLDHIIEKSREIIPTLMEAARTKPKSATLNWKEAYRLLFTKENLKLVQIACHKKSARTDNKCGVQDFIIIGRKNRGKKQKKQ